MWAPVDAAALPSARDLIDANTAIKIVETELEDAYLALAQIKTRIASLDDDLYQRRAWIAPVRRLSFDVLSHAFEICGEDSWITPLRISGVSRHWRNVVLATPRAWEFLPVHECGENRHLIDHFFQRSGQRPLHVFLNESQPLTLLIKVIERLQCLSVFDDSPMTEKMVFPCLNHLSLRNNGRAIALLDLRIARFPSLRELICEPNIQNDIAALPRSVKMTFPPLQVLSIAMESGTAWLDLLKGCRSSLISLRIHIVDDYPPPRQEVVLTLLKCLQIRLWGHTPTGWAMDLRTPALETYIEGPEWTLLSVPVRFTPAHYDVGTVTRIRISHAIDLTQVPLLVILQLDGNVDIDTIFSQLQDGRSLCQNLELVEIVGKDELARYKNRLVEVNRERLQQISVRHVETWATTLPHAIGPFPVSIQTRGYVPADVFSSAVRTCRAVEWIKTITTDTLSVAAPHNVSEFVRELPLEHGWRIRLFACVRCLYGVLESLSLSFPVVKRSS